MAIAGNELYQLLIRLTGLEEAKVRAELDPLLERLNLSPFTLTMDDVRRAMIVYLEEFSARMECDGDLADDSAFEEIEIDSERIEA